jgi:ribosomal protein S18 acetylase RimI-like enzyme
MTLRDLRPATPADHDAALVVQRAAFGRNVAIMGVEPLPLRADYAEIFATHEAWLAERDGVLQGMLILLPRDDDLYVWSIATAPAAQGTGVGRLMLAAAEERARALPRPRMRLRTSEKLTKNVTWYQRHGFTIESVQDLNDRRVVNMVKELA